MHRAPVRDDPHRIFPDLETMSHAAAAHFVAAVGEATEERGSAVIALAGGDTPRPLYRLLAAAPYRDRVAWPKLVVFFTDERQVPSGDPRSNVQMAKETLLDRVPVIPGRVHYPRMEDRDLARVAAEYAAEVSAHVPRGARDWPVFDLILLGLGADGHTASLFPGDPVLDEEAATVVPVHTSHAGSRRVTLTLPVVNAARRICFLVSGAEKAAAVARVFRDRDPSLPASRVRPETGSLAWFMDEPAARLLAER